MLLFQPLSLEYANAKGGHCTLPARQKPDCGSHGPAAADRSLARAINKVSVVQRLSSQNRTEILVVLDALFHAPRQSIQERRKPASPFQLRPRRSSKNPREAPNWKSIFRQRRRGIDSDAGRRD